MHTFFDVRHTAGYLAGLYANGTPLRRPEAERLAAECERKGQPCAIVPTSDTLWERTYGDSTDATSPRQ
jgi:hypothetical protein